MTLNELKEEICALGFEREIETDRRLVFAANRALRTVYGEYPVMREATLHVPRVDANVIFDEYIKTEGENPTFPLSGRAYSFTVSGAGSFAIVSGGKRERVEFNTPRHTFRGFIGEDASITFYGTISYTVYKLATFDRLIGPNKEDIPDMSAQRLIDISEVCGDFLAFSDVARDERGAPIEGQSRYSSVIRLPYDFCGTAHVRYRRRAPSVSADAPDAEIPAEEELLHLIPLLCASYYWLDDDAEKAERYLLLYRDGMSNLRAASRNNQGGGYDDVLRWA